ncbi:MAG: tRNA (adenosine(37)-N6)-threonylcarbamoyltransferase complex dimerization subunit type 1 TsaB [Bacteroidota bacterium]|nr:tRNA (adenosine(37)-N6)-threonylcarbamoyltransferase complex dimerization subunit type 1 TsaB [Bacteroidota bacterium]
MNYTLAIETSTKNCSVAIFEGSFLIGFKEEATRDYSHVEQLTVFIDELFKESDIDIDQLSTVAVSKGPGSYTGLRIGVATAKGICYALDIPLISISTLQAMALSMQKKEEAELYCPMIDARRMEVYSAFYNNKNKLVRDIQADIINQDSYKKELNNKVIFFGDEILKCQSVINSSNALFINQFYPSAKDFGFLIEEKIIQKAYEDLAYFEPFYLKDFVSINVKKAKD